MNKKTQTMAWQLHPDNPRHRSILTQALFLLDPMGTGCVENGVYDEYDATAIRLDHAMYEDDTSMLTAPMIERVCTEAFGEFGSKRVNVFFSAKAESIFKNFLGASLIYDFRAPPEIRQMEKMTGNDLEWGILETVDQFKDSVECGAFCYGEESGIWLLFHEGSYYQIGDVYSGDEFPANATHVFWYGK